jgi:hypothetical protein
VCPSSPGHGAHRTPMISSMHEIHLSVEFHQSLIMRVSTQAKPLLASVASAHTASQGWCFQTEDPTLEEGPTINGPQVCT